MKNAILLHGLPYKDEYYDPDQPSISNAHWFPWLQKQLLIHEVKTETPEVFRAYEMQWNEWVKEIKQFDINQDTILIGHSMGGGFWVRYLSEHPELKVAQVVLVAPWLNLKHEEDTDFFDFELNPNIIKQANQFTIFASDNDSVDVQNTVKFLQDKLPQIKTKLFHNYGHFCYRDMKTYKFPELLEEILA